MVGKWVIFMAALLLSACSTAPTAPGDSSGGVSPGFSYKTDRPSDQDRDWVNVCSLACLETGTDKPVEILLDADRYLPLHCWAFTLTGDEPDKSCTDRAWSLCNEQAHRINTQEPGYYLCSVEAANCYTPREMTTCNIER